MGVLSALDTSEAGVGIGAVAVAVSGAIGAIGKAVLNWRTHGDGVVVVRKGFRAETGFMMGEKSGRMSQVSCGQKFAKACGDAGPAGPKPPGTLGRHRGRPLGERRLLIRPRNARPFVLRAGKRAGGHGTHTTQPGQHAGDARKCHVCHACSFQLCLIN